MYAHSNTAFSRASTTTTTTLPSSASPPLIHHHLPTLTEFDSLFKLNNSEITSSSSSSCYGNNAASPTTNLSNFFAEVLYSDHAPVTRVYSTSHLQRTNEMQHNNNSSESSLSSECSIIIEGMNRACRYSPDEKKARIERYRSKRKQRNFNKKIKYACRKTLADSRPRIRGRFARNNEEADNNHPAQWHHIGGGEEEDEEYENWVSIYDSLVAANLAQESEDSSSFGLLY